MTQIELAGTDSSSGLARLAVAIGCSLAAVAATTMTGAFAVAQTTQLPAAAVLGMGALAFLIGLQGIRTDCGWNAAIQASGRPVERAGTLVGHCAGLVAGAGISAVLFYGVGQFVPIPMVLIGAALVVIGAFRAVRPTTVAPGGWKVPRVWSRLGYFRFMSLFGVILGLGFITTMASPAFVLLAAWTAHSGQLIVALFTFAAFATGRVATTASITVGGTHGGFRDSSAADAAILKVAPVGRLEGLLAVLLGLALLLGIW